MICFSFHIKEREGGRGKVQHKTSCTLNILFNKINREGGEEGTVANPDMLFLLDPDPSPARMPFNVKLPTFEK